MRNAESIQVSYAEMKHSLFRIPHSEIRIPTHHLTLVIRHLDELGSPQIMKVNHAFQYAFGGNNH
jgi:hypothetical protein